MPSLPSDAVSSPVRSSADTPDPLPSACRRAHGARRRSFGFGVGISLHLGLNLGLPLGVVPGLVGAAAIALALPRDAAAQTPAVEVPPLAELEAAGARIGQIRVVARDVFDLADPAEDKLLFRWANALHIHTRPDVIRRSLTLREGEPLRVRDVEESLRTLRGLRYLYDAQIRVVGWHDGVADLEVSTRDNWTLDPGFSAGRSGGANSSSVRLRDYNLLGTGTTAGIARVNDVDRSGTEFTLSNDKFSPYALAASLSVANNDDGRRDALSFGRPFYELDSRWAAGFTGVRDDRLDTLYDGGDGVGTFRHQENRAEVSAGWSEGLVGDRVLRSSVGLAYSEDLYQLEPGRVAPAALPADERLVSPFLRWDWREDRYRNLPNRNLIGRPEYFLLGTSATVKLGYAAKSLGSTRDLLWWSATASRGHELSPGEVLVGSLEFSGRYAFGAPDPAPETDDGVHRLDDRDGAQRLRWGASAKYYRPNGRWLFFTGLSADGLWRPGPVDQLLLGGDNGLRGYPLRYQSGTKRVLLTVEERYHTDWYLWRLFRVGAAGFVDVGRAWGGPWTNAADPGWLSDVGVGLRIANMRASFNNVIHVDLAMPVSPADGVKRVQFLVKAKATF